MHTPRQSFTPDSVQQIRDTMRRVTGLRPVDGQEGTRVLWRRVEEPKPDVVVWEDTEIDVRRVVL